jgi:anti-anti-sigma regulatory factor
MNEWIRELPEIKTAQELMDNFRVELAGDASVVTALDYVDISNSHFMRHDLLTASVYSTVVVANLSTVFCDSAAANMLFEVADMLADRGTELRTVTTRPLTLRLMRLFKSDARVRIFPTLLQALNAPQQERMPLPHYQAA